MVYNTRMNRMKQKITNVVAVRTIFLAFLFLGMPEVVFAIQSTPIALTKQATFVTEKSAKLNGQANPNQMPDTVSWFEWGITGRASVVYQTPRRAMGGVGTVLIDTSADIVGLAPSTQYFFRQYAENGRGKDIGQIVYFTTKDLANDVPPLVIVETNNPSIIGETNATIKGYVSPHGNNQTKAWFDWGTTQRFENQTQSANVSTVAAPFERPLTNLVPGTTYFYRIVAENSAGRVYGATRIFSTRGIPPPKSEEPINQQVSTGTAGDGVARNTTSSGAPKAGTQSSAFGATDGSRPGDFLGALMRKKNGGATTTQVAGVAQSDPSLWDRLTGKGAVAIDGVVVTIEKVGPKKVVAHTPVEYRIVYAYRRNVPATNAKLKIILPSEVIYIGDTTNNELLLEDNAGGGERTYVLPIGRLESGSTRTVSILGMTTGDAKGFPDARARLEYDDGAGTHVATAGAPVKDSGEKTASVEKSGNGILPSSFLGWLLYIVLVVAAIIGFRKGKEYYDKRKEQLEAEEKEDADRLKLIRMLPTEENANPAR